MQYEFFEDNDFYKIDGDSKTCRYCKKELPLDFFQVRYKGYTPEGTRGRNHICNDCFRKSQRLVKWLRQNSPPEPANKLCQCCEKETENFHLDHCHDTESFRGWVCRSCNIGLGFLNDDVETVEKALNYLRRTNDSIRY